MSTSTKPTRILLTAAALAGVLAPTASARSQPTRADLAKAVSAVAFERVYGSNYRILKARYPTQIDWSNDGCSVPRALLASSPAVPYYAGLFQKSCDRHDFGYRNYGSRAGGLALDPTETRRARIDLRFRANMDHQCDRVFARRYLEAVQRADCKSASWAFFKAVSLRAQPSFFAG